MSLYRTTIAALATLFTAAMTSAALACCGGGSYAVYGYGWNSCNGCGAVPVFAPPAPVVQIAPPAPLVTTGWGTGCGCGQAIVYATPAQEPIPVSPAAIYVTNQGPDYTGPGIMEPYRIWSPAQGYAPAPDYPYVSGYGYGYPLPYRVHPHLHHYYHAAGPRFAEHYHPHYYAPARHWRAYPHRPLGVRD